MYTLVLTHDIDYLSLREIPWSSRTLWGFSYRCLKAAVSRTKRNLDLQQRISLLWNGVTMPLIKLGLRSDPWASSLDLMVSMERRLGVRSSLFFLPFPSVRGRMESGTDAPSTRAAFYDVRDYAERIVWLEKEGWEIGVHGIDSYWDPTAARDEKMVIENILGHDTLGIRIHWLYYKGERTWDILSRAGYRYDATLGTNEDVGYPCGLFAPFYPFAGRAFQILPLNVQDETLFETMGLSEQEAWETVDALIDTANEKSAVVTLLWHNYSFTVPMLWGALYERIIRRAQADGAKIVRAIDVVN